MDSMLMKRTMRITQDSFTKREDAPLSGDYVLPEYCPDVAVVLKCLAYPHLQSRQWSGEQLLVDGTAVVRILYADEQRRCVRTAEFAQPFSCALRGIPQTDDTAVEVELSTKYLTCRAISPRRLEVRGAISVEVCANNTISMELAVPTEVEGFHTLTETIPVTIPGHMHEKITTISECLEFNDSLPPAEMLLGGACCAVINECKLLTGKAILKGLIYIHQLYTDSADGQHTNCLDYAIPFSQILDVPEAAEGLPYCSSVQVLSDIERCVVGPDGENSVLEVAVKLLLQIQVYQQSEVKLLYDAYHCQYPIETKTDNISCCTVLEQRFEETKFPVRLSIPIQKWQAIIDLWWQVIDSHCECMDGHVLLKGRLQFGVLVRDVDGEIGYHEFTEDFVTEYNCSGNHADVKPMVIDVQYRSTDSALECMVYLHATVMDRQLHQQRIIGDVHLCSDRPYPSPHASTLLYYGEVGETVWDIARQCHTSPMSILEENALECERLTEKTILAIPIL